MFPARAGMSRHTIEVTGSGMGVPRASGDEPNLVVATADNLTCSPRERG